MKKTWKIAFSALCVLVLLVSILAVAAFAEDAEPVVETEDYYEEPAPAYEEPAPLYEEPAPLYEEPAPVYEEPAPAYEEPAPVYEESAPAYEEPAPAEEGPAVEEPVAEEPAGEAPAAELEEVPADETLPADEAEPAAPAEDEASPKEDEAASTEEDPAEEAAPFDVEEAYRYYMSLETEAEKEEYLLSLTDTDREVLMRYICEKEAEAASLAAQEAAEEVPDTDVTEDEIPDETGEAFVEIDDYETPLGLVQGVTVWHENLSEGAIGIGSLVRFNSELQGMDPDAVSYQWQISADGETWTDIADANGSTYTVTVDMDNAAANWRVLVSI